MRQKLIDFASLITLELDFSEEDVAFADRKSLDLLIDELTKKIKSLIDSFQYGSVVKQGIPVVITGKPNAGKSSLLNTLLNEDRAIVSEIPGTTRDTIEDIVNIEGLQFRFIDTAGLRETNDKIEYIGVEKAKEKVKKARILIYMFDQSDVTVEEILMTIKNFDRQSLITILVENKIDLRKNSEDSKFDNDLIKKIKNHSIADFIKISTFDNESVGRLKRSLYNQLKGNTQNGDIVVTNVRHLHSLQKSLKSIKNIKNGLKDNLSGDLLSVDINEALSYLGEISGEITNDELLGNIFSLNFA